MNIDQLIKAIKPLDLAVKPGISDAELAYFRFYGLDFESRYAQLSHYFGWINSPHLDDSKIVCHYFELPAATKTCFILHGYFDHAGLFSHLVDYSLSRGYNVVLFDWPGHGLSTGTSVCIGSFHDYRAVLKDVGDFFTEHQTPSPWFAIAQSMGGAAMADYLLHERDMRFEKTVLLAPLVRPVDWDRAYLLYLVVKFFRRRWPRNYVVNSSDPKFVEFVQKGDPLQAANLSVRWVGALSRWIKRFDDYPALDDYPMLIVQGKADKTVDWQYNLAKLKQKFSSSKVIYLADASHHLANEREELRQTMYTAMDMYLSL